MSTQPKDVIGPTPIPSRPVSCISFCNLGQGGSQQAASLMLFDSQQPVLVAFFIE